MHQEQEASLICFCINVFSALPVAKTNFGRDSKLVAYPLGHVTVRVILISHRVVVCFKVTFTPLTTHSLVQIKSHQKIDPLMHFSNVTNSYWLKWNKS